VGQAGPKEVLKAVGLRLIIFRQGRSVLSRTLVDAAAGALHSPFLVHWITTLRKSSDAGSVFTCS
jgi:hypothetical protein